MPAMILAMRAMCLAMPATIFAGVFSYFNRQIMQPLSWKRYHEKIPWTISTAFPGP